MKKEYSKPTIHVEILSLAKQLIYPKIKYVLLLKTKNSSFHYEITHLVNNIRCHNNWYISNIHQQTRLFSC